MNSVRIGDIADVNPRVPRELLASPTRQVNFVPMSHVSEHGTLTCNGVRALQEVSKGYTYFANGDIIVAKITPCLENGKAALVSGLSCGVAFGSTEFHVVRPHQNVEPRYVFYMLWNPIFRRTAARSMTGSAGQQRVPASFLANFRVPLPSSERQKHIADILDKAIAIERRHESANDIAAELPASIFYQHFGDPLKDSGRSNLGRIGDIFAIPPNYGTMAVPSDREGSWLDLRVANIQNGDLDLSDRKYVELDPDLIPRHEVLPGDLLLARAIGSIEHLGKCIIANPAGEKWAFDSHLMRVRFDRKKVEPRYVHAFLTTPGGRHEFLRNARRSAVQYNINTKELAKIRIPLPPLSDQRHFVAALEKLDALVKRQCEATMAAESLFESLSDRAFHGKL